MNAKHFYIMLLFLVMSATALAQTNRPEQAEPASGDAADLTDLTELTAEQERERIQAEIQAAAIEQLKDIQESLKVKVAERKELRAEIRQAGDDAPEELSQALAELEDEISLLEQTFEQIAIGGIDLSVFGVEEESFDWREELVTIVKPLLENVKGLTEKPRKIENLRRVIDEKQAAMDASADAMESIEELKSEAENESVLNKLSAIEDDWTSRSADLEREVQLAQFQLENLEGKNVPWFEILKRAGSDFISGRGLTLLLLVLISAAIWFFTRGILWIIRRQTSKSDDRDSKTTYRLAAYGYKIFTGILICVGIMMVLYFRQDLLLLAIVVIIFVGAALALKNLLPRYIAESRLLLNIGSVRERERIMLDGVPWLVLSIKMHTRLMNPELDGSLRMPLYRLHDMTSRPIAKNATWFPSSKGDWVLDDDSNPFQVLNQNVEFVELQDVNGLSQYIPTPEYYGAKFRNLTRGKDFRIAIRFGIDYATQKIPHQEISKKFAEGLTTSFSEEPFAEHTVSLDADFDSAGDSSLDYLMLAIFKPEAARYYNRIRRRISQVCVTVCNEEGWGIPFPQLTLHRPSDGQAESDDRPQETTEKE